MQEVIKAWCDDWITDLPLSVIMLDNTFKILYLNEHASKLLNVSSLETHYFDENFRASCLNRLENFKVTLENDFYAITEIKTKEYGEVKFVGHRFNEKDNLHTYMIMMIPLDYKERHLRSMYKHQALLENMSLGVFTLDINYKIIDVNIAFLQMSGYHKEEILGKTPSLFKSEKQDPSFYKKMYHELNINGIFRGDLIDRKKNGLLFHVKVVIYAIKNYLGNIESYTVVLEDISELHSLKARLVASTNVDKLTGVYNRETFLNVLKVKIELSSYENQTALLFIDLNKFKMINDTFGHRYGDSVLAQAAHRIEKVLRQNDLVGRYGGDEFLVLLERVTYETASIIARKIDNSLAESYTVEGTTLDFVSGSIGVVIAPNEGNNTHELIEKADAAMYEAKQTSNSNIFFAKDFSANPHQSRNMRTELIHAIEMEEFYIKLQPIVSSEDGNIVGGEVLTRWLNLYYDNVPPSTFIPLAEKMCLMKKIDTHILDLAVSFIEENDFDDSFFINVNFSGEQFNDIDFIDLLSDYVERCPKLIQHLVIEITEGTMIENVEVTSEYLHSIRDLGLRVAIDDFGTGFSSLSYLKHFSIDFLKIDISFVENIENSKKDCAIVQAIISLAEAIGAKTIVEGIETQGQYEIIKQMGATYLQGFYFHKPMYIKDFTKKVF